MADEELTSPAEGGDDELLLDTPIVEEAQPDPVAELASEMGWVPKEAYKGDPDNWRDAATFIRAGKDIQKSMSRELKDVRSTVENMARTSATLFEQQMKAERDKLEAKFAAAVDEGDHQEAFKISREIDRVAQPLKKGPPPEAEAFAERHSTWFDKDPLATARAIEVANLYAGKGYDTAAQLEAAERTVKREFPELFPAPSKPQARVGEPSRSASTSRKKGFADLPPEAQRVARDMNERMPSVTLEMYAENYFADQQKQGGR